MGGELLIGYLEKPNNQQILCRQYFPSKYGGKPAWLNPQYLPNFKDLNCEYCGILMTFFLQIYAPIDDRDDLFHRAIFVFICIHCSSSIMALRCQLPKNNPYYDINPHQPPIEYNSEIFHDEYSKLNCDICGLPLDIIYHKELNHTLCISQDPKKLILPEYEIIVEFGDDYQSSDNKTDNSDTIEDQDISEEDLNENMEYHESTLLSDYYKKIIHDPDNDLDESEMNAFDKIQDMNVNDYAFDKFINYSKKYKQHVIRYNYGGDILWFSDHSRRQNNVPKCDKCGGDRIFEFQIQPEIIILGHLPSTIDFGIVLIYTCSKNCSSDSTAYTQEYVFIQENPY
ncbi:hypothetical protein ACR3K2_35340 [Cryptosporidium serpentis]